MTLLNHLRTLSLLVVTGKGGVGKSTLTATLGRILAQSGKRVLLLEADPRESLYQLLGVAPLGGSISVVAPGLYVHNVRPRDVVDELIRERLWIDLLVNRVMASSVYQHFVEGAPGLEQMAVLGYSLRVVRGESARELGGIDLVILDAPATGHGVSMLAAPSLVSEVIREGPLGEMSAELAQFTADPDKCGVAVVSLAEEMPVTETLELLESMQQRLDRRPELVVVNGLYPPLDGSEGKAHPEQQPVLDLLRERHLVNRRELTRLTASWSGPLLQLPMTPLDRGPELVDALRGRLEVALTEPRYGVGAMSTDARRFTVVVGPGGVGKTTLAAALGLHMAGEGHDTLVMTFDPSLRLKDSLGVGDEARDRPVEVQAGTPGRLEAGLLDARRTFDRLVERYAPDEEARDRILQNRFYDHLAGHLSGILEFMAVERLFEVASDPHYDRVVLDTPPTRQALDFLEAPERIVSFLDSGALRIALRPWFDDEGRVRAASRLLGLGKRIERYLDRIIGVELLRQMAEFFQAFGPLFEGFKQRASKVRELLRSPETEFMLVSRPGEGSTPETMFFARHLEQAGYRLGQVVLNRIHPHLPRVCESHGASDTEGLRLLRWLGERDHAGVEEIRALLPRHSLISVPLLPSAPAELRTLWEIGARLAEGHSGG